MQGFSGMVVRAKTELWAEEPEWLVDAFSTAMTGENVAYRAYSAFLLESKWVGES
jgi:hypothetical protein